MYIVHAICKHSPWAREFLSILRSRQANPSQAPLWPARQAAWQRTDGMCTLCVSCSAPCCLTSLMPIPRDFPFNLRRQQVYVWYGLGVGPTLRNSPAASDKNSPFFPSAVSLHQSIYVNICQRTVCPIDVIVPILSIYGCYISYKENPRKIATLQQFKPKNGIRDWLIHRCIKHRGDFQLVCFYLFLSLLSVSICFTCFFISFYIRVWQIYSNIQI